MITFIDEHRGIHWVEPICKVLLIAPSTYHEHVAKWADSEKLSVRAKKDMARSRKSPASSERTLKSMVSAMAHNSSVTFHDCARFVGSSVITPHHAFSIVHG